VNLEVFLTYQIGNEIFTVRGTPKGMEGSQFVLRKAEGGVLKISERLILKIEEIK